MRCLKFASEISLITILFANYSHKMFYIFRCAKIGHHDIIDVFKTEYITSKFDTFSIVCCDALYPEWFISYADSLATSEDKCLISVQDFATFDDIYFFSLFSDDCCHLSIVKYDHIAHFHDVDYFWEADLEFSWLTESVL